MMHFSSCIGICYWGNLIAEGRICLLEDMCLHIAVILFTIFAAWRWGDWRNWPKYHLTMLFISGGALLYLFLYKDALLWDLQHHLMNHTLTELLYVLTVLPLTVLLFLSNYPDGFGKQAYRIIKFIAIYSIMEFIYYKFGLITYKYGWNFWLSIGWYCMMFPVLALHLKSRYMLILFLLLVWLFFLTCFQ
jgi:hypothetical protein